MVLQDQPFAISGWVSGVEPAMEEKIGKLAIVSARVEGELHKIYWEYAGVDERTGPIITDSLGPSDLTAAIKKLADIKETNPAKRADLRLLIVEANEVFPLRNRCLHWDWEVPDYSDLKNIEIKTEFSYPTQPLKLSMPSYKQKKPPPEQYSADEIDKICSRFSWLRVRLSAHIVSEAVLVAARSVLEDQGEIAGVSLADLFLPAPWLLEPLKS